MNRKMRKRAKFRERDSLFWFLNVVVAVSIMTSFSPTCVIPTNLEAKQFGLSFRKTYKGENLVPTTNIFTKFKY